MRKITLLLLVLGVVITVSCEEKKSKKMLYDYQQKNVKTLNFDLDDLNFKIEKIEKISDITAADSIKILRQELAEYWRNKPEKSLIDTLSFKYVKSALNEIIARKDTLYKLYQEAVLTAIRIDDYSYEMESRRKRDETMDEMFSYKNTLSKIELLENYYNELLRKPDSILSSQYRAIYSQTNPLLGNVKQTFDKIFYTNPTQTEFVKEDLYIEE